MKYHRLGRRHLSLSLSLDFSLLGILGDLCECTRAQCKPAAGSCVGLSCHTVGGRIVKTPALQMSTNIRAQLLSQVHTATSSSHGKLRTAVMDFSCLRQRPRHKIHKHGKQACAQPHVPVFWCLHRRCENAPHDGYMECRLCTVGPAQAAQRMG